MHVRNCWYVAAWGWELPASELLARTLINEPIVLFRKDNGEVVALEDRCCHRQAPLSMGRKEGDSLRCMYHGMRFDCSGKCVEIPGQEIIPPNAKVRGFPVIERHSWIWVWMGDPARADPALVPPAVGLEDPKWALRHGQMDYEANHALISDNLTDFSHLAYVHANTLSAGTDATAKSYPKVKTLERGIRVQRWLVNSGNRRFADGAADAWMTYDYLAPGILLMLSERYPVGTAEQFGFDVPSPSCEPLSANFTSQAVTALTDDTSRYFYSWGPRAVDAQANPQLPDLMLDLANRAFEEDRRIIEAQQRNLKRYPATNRVSIGHDRGPTLMRQVMKRLMLADGGETALAMADED